MPPDAATRRRALIALVAGAFCIGTAPIFTKLGMDHGHVGPAAAAFWRMALAAPIFMLTLALFHRPSTTSAAARPFRWLLAAPGVVFAADLACWHTSFHYTSVGLATLLANCAIVIVAVIGWRWLGERLDWRFALGTTLALIGVATLLGEDLTSNRNSLKGDLLALATAAFYATYILTMKRLRRDCPTLQIMVWSTGVAALVLAPWAIWGEAQRWIPDTAAGWSALIALALTAHVAGQGLITYGLAHLPASFSAVTLLIQPVAATLLGWLILGETLGATRMVGGTVVLIGILMAQRGVVSKNA